MNDSDGYAVFFFPQALEALGDAIKPYMQDGPAGPHVVCKGVDTGGSLIEMNLNGTTQDGTAVELELMVPSGMVRMIVSAHSDEVFGFGPHPMKGAVQKVTIVAGEVDTVATEKSEDAEEAVTAVAEAPSAAPAPAAEEARPDAAKVEPDTG